MKTTITQNQFSRNFSRLKQSCWSVVFFLTFLLSATSSWGQVTTLQNWSNLYQNTSTSSETVAYSIPAGSGTNKLLAVAIASSQDVVGARSVTITYGGQTMTLASGDMATTTTRQHTAIYYLNEAGIDAAANTNLVFTVSGGTTRVTTVWAAVFDYVDQTSPITNSQNYNSIAVNATTDTFVFSSNLTINNRDQAVLVLSSLRNGNPGFRSISTLPTSFTSVNEQTWGTVDGVRNAILNRSVPTSNTSSNCSTVMSNSSRGSMTGVSFKGCAAPTVNAGSALANICIGGTSAGLGGSTGGSATGGTWSSSEAGGSFSPNATTLNATYTPPSTYTGTVTLTLTSSGGTCGTASASKTLTVTAPNSATISYAGTPFCRSLTAGQAVTRTGTTGGTYTASPAGLTINASTGAITPSTSTAGTYTVTYTMAAAGGCSAVTTTTSVTINNNPTASISGTTTACGLVTLTASGGTSYLWSSGSSTATAANSFTASGTYTVTVTNNNGCTNTASQAVIVNPIPTSVTATPSETAICIGDSIDLTSSATSNSTTATTVLSQDFNGTPTGWTTTNTSTGATPAKAAWTLRASGYNSGSSGFVTLITPDASSFYLSDSDAQGSGGTTNTTLVSPAFSTIGMSAGSINLSHYYRYLSGTIDRAFVDASTDGNNWTNLITYSTSQGSASAFATPTISLTGTFLNKSTVYIRFRYAGAWSWFWAINNVTVSGTLNTPPAATFAWTSTPAGFTSSTQNPTGVTPTVATTYTVTATNSYGCTASATTSSVAVNALPTVTASPDQSICAGSDATISASGATSYIWSNSLGTASSVTVSPSTTTTYTVTGTDANGCTNTANTTVAVNPIQTANVSIEASATTICSGTSVTFTATPTNGGTAPTYQWKVNGNNVGSNSATFTSSTLVNGDVVTCVMTSNANVCLSGSPATSNSISITVNTPIGITAITPATNPIAPTQTTTITATGVVGTGALVSWYSAPNQSGLLGTGLTSPAVAPGTYYAVVTGTCGSAIELSTTISPLASWTGNVNNLWHVTGNWAEGVLPNAATNVVIGDGKVVVISTADAVANTITINGSGTLTVQSGRTVTVTNAINTTSASQFVLENNANLLQGGTTNQNAGPITVKRNSSSIIRLDYTLWSSPVASQGLYAFSKTTLPNRFYKYDTNTNFYTNSVGFNLTNLQYPSPLVAPNGINGTDTAGVTFETGKGYLIRVPWNHPTAPTSWTGNFTGVPNNGTITYTMSNFGAGLNFNLVGNPYPSPISISQFIQDNQANITSSIYFWRKTNGSSSDTYCEWNDEIFTDNNDAQSFDPGDTIRTGQGFFVEATGASNTLVFNNGQRVNDTANQFFRTSATNTLSTQNVFWLNLTGSNAQFSQTAIAYKSYATNGLDRYDAKRIAPGTISLTSTVEGNNLAIQSKSDFVNTDVVPLSYVVAAAGNYSITLDNKIGIFSTGQTIYLRDRLLNVDFNLASGSYTFESEVGTFDNRFEIIYQSQLAIGTPTFNENTVIIYNQNNNLEINTGNVIMASIKVFDIRGRLLQEKKAINASQTTMGSGLANQVLLVQITSEDGVMVTKKVIR